MGHLPTTPADQATGDLAAAYAELGARPLPPAYRPQHGGAPGILRAHSLDPALMLRVFRTSGVINGRGPLPWADRELATPATPSGGGS